LGWPFNNFGKGLKGNVTHPNLRRGDQQQRTVVVEPVRVQNWWGKLIKKKKRKTKGPECMERKKAYRREKSPLYPGNPGGWTRGWEGGLPGRGGNNDSLQKRDKQQARPPKPDKQGWGEEQFSGKRIVAARRN